MKEIKLRGHHIKGVYYALFSLFEICISKERWLNETAMYNLPPEKPRGYKFAYNFLEIVEKLYEHPEQRILFVDGLDDLCINCNNSNENCLDNTFDDKTIKEFKLKIDRSYPWSEIEKRIITREKRYGKEGIVLTRK